MPTKKQYLLKPGKHQFAPGEQPVHHNGSISDEEARWYIEKYPHIKKLFRRMPKQTDAAEIKAISHQ